MAPWLPRVQCMVCGIGLPKPQVHTVEPGRFCANETDFERLPVRTHRVRVEIIVEIEASSVADAERRTRVEFLGFRSDGVIAKFLGYVEGGS